MAYFKNKLGRIVNVNEADIPEFIKQNPDVKNPQGETLIRVERLADTSKEVKDHKAEQLRKGQKSEDVQAQIDQVASPALKTMGAMLREAFTPKAESPTSKSAKKTKGADAVDGE